VFVRSMGVEVHRRLYEQHYATGCSNMSLSLTGLHCVQILNGHVEDQEPKFVCDVQTRHDWSTGMASPKTYTKVAAFISVLSSKPTCYNNIVCALNVSDWINCG